MRRYALILCVALAGCGQTVTRTLTVPTPQPVPAPIVPKAGATAPPADSAPSCEGTARAEIEAGKGHAGACAPKPTRFGASATPTGRTGPDLSNNDPLYSWGPVHAHGHPFAYLKVNQGVGFIDRTAGAMASGARAAGVTPGGYDFLEVCRGNPVDEARLFASRLKAIGLAGHAFTPVGDAEWPLSVPCSASGARRWLTGWTDTVHALTGRWAAIYTGAWWWNPNVGCWRPPHALRWVSGYGSRRSLPIPCGWGGVDLWQYTNAGFNGVSSTDMSLLEVSFSKFTGSAPPTPAQKRASKRRSLAAHRRLRAVLHGDIDRHHCRPGQHASPSAYHTVCGYWLRRGGQTIQVIRRLEHELR